MNISLRRTEECTRRRTVKRIPDTEQRRADPVKSCQGTPWDRLAGRPAGRPHKTALQAPPVETPPAATESERPSDDVSERRGAKAQDLTPPVVPHVPPAPRAEQKITEPSTASRPVDADHGSASVDPASDDLSQVRSSAPALSSPDVHTRPSGKRSVQAGQPEQSKSNTSSGVERGARAAELPDEDEGGSKFDRVEGLTTFDAKEVTCESSVEDDFEVDETAKGVDEETVNAILAGKKCV